MIANFLFLCCVLTLPVCVAAIIRVQAVYVVRTTILDRGGVFGGYSRLPTYDEMMEFRHWGRWTVRQWEAWLEWRVEP